VPSSIPSGPGSFSERLSRKVLSSLQALNAQLGEVRLSVAKIDSIANPSGQLRFVVPPAAPAAAAQDAGVPAVAPTAPPTAPAPAAGVDLLRRVLLAPGLEGAGLDEGLLEEVGRALPASALAEVRAHVAFRPATGRVGEAARHAPARAAHTPPPEAWHPGGNAGHHPARSSGLAHHLPASPGRDAAAEEEEEGGAHAGAHVIPAARRVTLRPVGPVAMPGVPPPVRWYTFPRYTPTGWEAEEGDEEGVDTGEGSIPFKSTPVDEEEFAALMEDVPEGEEEGEDGHGGGGPVPGESATEPAGARTDPFTVQDESPMPTVRDWNGGDAEWETGETDGSSTPSSVRFEAYSLRVVYQAGRTGFEDAKEFAAVPGDLIAGRYRVQSFLGSAAFSSALSCVDESTGAEVALKVIKNNKDFVDQSLDEIKLLRYLNAVGDADAHRVLRLIDYFYHAEHLFLVTELLKDNLYEWSTYVESNELEPYFTLPRVQRIAAQVLQALAFIHSNGLQHCDLKPENVLVLSYSRCDVKVIDFGSSCFISDKMSSYIQSRSYRAPEVVLSLPYGPKIDVWSLGCILTELLSGRVLFPNESVQTMLVRMQVRAASPRPPLARADLAPHPPFPPRSRSWGPFPSACCRRLAQRRASTLPPLGACSRRRKAARSTSCARCGLASPCGRARTTRYGSISSRLC
jgi:hypothetical protein